MDFQSIVVVSVPSSCTPMYEVVPSSQSKNLLTAYVENDNLSVTYKTAYKIRPKVIVVSSSSVSSSVISSSVLSSSQVQSSFEVSSSSQVQSSFEVSSSSQVQSSFEVSSSSQVQSSSEVSSSSQVQSSFEVSSSSQVQSSSQVSSSSFSQQIGSRLGDSLALVAIYENMNGINWGGNYTEWLSDHKLENWGGVTINFISGRVSKLDLNYADLVGDMPYEVMNLTALTFFDARNSNIQNLYRDFGKLPSLEVLRLDIEHLSEFPSSMVDLQNLEKIILDGPGLTELPEWIYSLSSLQYLWIRNSDLTSISSRIGEMLELTDIEFTNNKITSLPDELGLLINLWNLKVNNNQITQIPPSIFSLPKLDHLSFVRNSLESVPSEIENARGMRYLYLNSNKIKIVPDLSELESLFEALFHDNEISIFPKVYTGYKPSNFPYSFYDNKFDFNELENLGLQEFV
jgi:Leucine-rich repeat (LRR) protein